MKTILSFVLLVTFITNASALARSENRKRHFDSKRTSQADDLEQDNLVQTLRDILTYQKRSEDWQGYVDDQLIGAGLQNAAILGLDGNTWASSPGFSLKPGEGAAIAYLFKKPSDVFARGITVADVKYVGLRADSDSIYGKKGMGGVIAVKTTQTIIIGVYNDKLRPGNAHLIVEKLGDYLREIGY